MYILITILCFNFILSSLLTYLNVAHLKKSANNASLPDALKLRFGQKEITGSVLYTSDKAKLGFAGDVVSLAVLVFMVSSGFFRYIVEAVGSWNVPALARGLAVLAVPGLILYLAGIPASLAMDFKVEKKYGFSTITVKTWLLDQVRGLVISAVLFFLLFSGLFLLMKACGGWWWLWFWLFFAVFVLFIQFITPVVIMPLFNKFEPLKDTVLADSALRLADKAGFPVAGVFQMDASKRSTHGNAFFTGLGKTRRIVFYDTILSKHTTQELLAVLGHEIGHWKKGHIRKSVILQIALSGAIFYIVAKLLSSVWLYKVLGIADIYRAAGLTPAVIGAGLFVISVLFSPVSLLLSPVFTRISRMFEYDADRFSIDVYGDAAAMKDALIKLASDNLSNLFPHPLYVIFHYSHPPLLERLKAIDRYARK
jgi:STE24 endopeptidase